MSYFKSIVSQEIDSPNVSVDISKSNLTQFILQFIKKEDLSQFADLLTPDNKIQIKWDQFFEKLGNRGWDDISSAKDTIEKWIHENGITYNINQPTGNSKKHWSLNPLPNIIPPHEWKVLSEGLTTHAKLLNTIAQDVYGDQTLLKEGIIPPESIFGNPGYLRSLFDVKPLDGIYLYTIAYDISCDQNGIYRILNCRTQSPSGLGYILENRLILSKLFPDAFREMKIEHIASTYKLLLDSLIQTAKRISEGDPKFVLLTPGSHDETYFEHAYLARYLGLPLVEGADLTVRDDKLYLKTLLGLERIHGVFRRQLDESCDPLELRPDSISGIPGLLQAIRAGNVLISNALGTGFLESKLLLDRIPNVLSHFNKIGFFPNLSPSDEIRNTYFKTDSPNENYYKIPVYKDDKIIPRDSTIRVYVLYSGNGIWKVLPGGLTRSYSSKPNSKEARKLGGATHDTWVMTDGDVDTFSLLSKSSTRDSWVAHKQMVSSRSGENQYWMGRYTERCESMIRLARESLVLTNTRGSEVLLGLQNSISELCIRFQLTPVGTVGLLQSQNLFTRTMINFILKRGSFSLLDNILSLESVILSLKDKLPSDHSRVLNHIRDCLDTNLNKQISQHENLNLIAIDTMDTIGLQLASLVGLQSDRMTRDLGWHLLILGRLIERTIIHSDILTSFFNKKAHQSTRGFEFLLVLFDSTITYQTRYQRQQDMNALIDLLVYDKTNPRALACMIESIRIELSYLPNSEDLLKHIESLEPRENDESQIEEYTLNLSEQSRILSDKISSRFFAHATNQMLST
jgi:uncharacterized circularly permuted ATP-grasp superfamily protein/uncharacterized alpha-E superfamily protein